MQNSPRRRVGRSSSYLVSVLEAMWRCCSAAPWRTALVTMRSTARPDPPRRPAARRARHAVALALPPPPLACHAVLSPRRWRRCSGTRARSRGREAARAQLPRGAVGGRRNRRKKLRGEFVQLVGERIDGGAAAIISNDQPRLNAAAPA